jgi:hypothetical protein
MCTFTARSLMNGDEAARNAPCTICSIRILNIRKCKQRCLSTFVTLVMMKGIVLILLSNLGTRIFLRGVGYDAPGFKLASLTLTTESPSQTCWHWSNLGQPGSSPWKPHQQTLMALLIKSTQTCGQPLVKGTVKPHWHHNVFERPPELLPRSPNFT